jgi:hypothetical protein
LRKAKKGGQFYTPRSVVELLVEMLEPYKGRVFDPCCGSGGMFVQSEKFVADHQGKVNDEEQGRRQSRMADIAQAWIEGKTIHEMAVSFFDGSGSDEISKVYKAIYGKLANGGTWGLSALSRMSGIDFETLPDEKKRQLNLMPAMLYHGVKSEESVLMRMNSVPRSFAEALGNKFKQQVKNRNIVTARQYLKGLVDSDWNSVTSHCQYISGRECKKVWQILSGEAES